MGTTTATEEVEEVKIATTPPKANNNMKGKRVTAAANKAAAGND